MSFEVTAAKREILRKLAEQDWTPTDLASELGTSRNTVYNHLNDLYEQGILAKRQVPAKTRPKTEYSIGDGFVQYLTVVPGQYAERSHALTPEKRAVLGIWSLPQEAFHPYVDRYWRELTTTDAFDFRDALRGLAVYGSVARGQADADSDLDFFALATDHAARDAIDETFGTRRLEVGDDSTIAMTESLSIEEYAEGLSLDSDFLARLRDEFHLIYDPDGVLQHPERVSQSEQ